MNCYTKKQQLNLTKKAVTNKSTSPLMWLIKIATEALGSTHSRRQLKIYVICKADSEEPKNKSEFIFLKRRLIWVFCNGYKVQFSSLLFCRWFIKYWNQKRYLTDCKKKKKKNRAGCHIGLFRSGPTLLAWQSLQGLETECRFKQSIRRLVQVIVSCPKSKLLFCGPRVYFCMNPMQRPTDRCSDKSKKVPYRKYEKGRSRLMCSYAQSDKSILFIVHTYKAWHSLCIILAVLLFWVACAANLVAINLYEQNKVCLSQFKFLVTSKGL